MLGGALSAVDTSTTVRGIPCGRFPLAWGLLWTSGAEGVLLSIAFADDLGGIVEEANGVVAVRSIFVRLTFLRMQKKVIVRTKTVTIDATLAIIIILCPLVPEGTAVPVLATLAVSEGTAVFPQLVVVPELCKNDCKSISRKCTKGEVYLHGSNTYLGYSSSTSARYSSAVFQLSHRATGAVRDISGPRAVRGPFERD
jgi:hypothetical protein